MSEVVSASGFKALTASGGKEALEKARSEHPELILLDLNMPDIDGWTVLRKMKEEGLTNEIKVMMLTATVDVSTDIFGLQDVVSGYIRKPFNNKELSDRLKSVLEEPLEEKEDRESGGILRFLDRMRASSTTDGREKARRSF